MNVEIPGGDHAIFIDVRMKALYYGDNLQNAVGAAG